MAFVILSTVAFIIFFNLFATNDTWTLANPIASTRKNSIVFSTYNLWNVMFNWNVRKHHIGQMILTHHPDVIGFQEVRSSSQNNRSQIDDLQYILPEYQWKVFHPVNEMELVSDIIQKDMNIEGLGFLSRHPILNVTTISLTSTNSPDKNNRALLSITINLPKIGHVDIILVHFSYEKMQQCKNAAELANFLAGITNKFSVVLGDFNLYENFQDPANLLLLGKNSQSFKQCSRSYYERNSFPPKQEYVDAWKAVYKEDKKGYTYSNMPQPGLESRPDRIFVKGFLQVTSAQLDGNGTTYQKSYYRAIMRQRLKNMFWAMYKSFEGEFGYSCYHDCGPHGSCRCGMCVNIGNHESCSLDDCRECNPHRLPTLTLIFLLIIVALMYTCMSLSRFFIGSRKQIPYSFCILWNTFLLCCARTICWPLLSRFYPFARLPAGLQILLSLICFCVILIWGSLFFQDSIVTLQSILPEELYPSDHLLLTVHLKAI